MINSDKIGKFIAEQREKRNISQEKLGEIIGIGRDSISKWERGINLPSHEMLLKLSELFEVSVNEILYGEQINKENEKQINGVPLVFYTYIRKIKKIFIGLVAIIIILLLVFGGYYFFNSYKSVKIYTINGENENVVITNGIFIKTKEKVYLNVDQIDLKNDKKIRRITLFYKEKDNIIYSSDSSSISISDYFGANEYFEKEYLKDITNNLYLLLEYEDTALDQIQLLFVQDYINDSLFFKKKEKTITDKKINELDVIPADLNYLIENIEKTYKNKDNIFSYDKKEKGFEYSSFYIPDSGTLGLVITKDDNVIEEWNYYALGRSLTYNNYNKSELLYNFIYENEEINCTIGNCEDAQEKIDYFWLFLHKSV